MSKNSFVILFFILFFCGWRYRAKAQHYVSKEDFFGYNIELLLKDNFTYSLFGYSSNDHSAGILPISCGKYSKKEKHVIELRDRDLHYDLELKENFVVDSSTIFYRAFPFFNGFHMPLKVDLVDLTKSNIPLIKMRPEFSASADSELTVINAKPTAKRLTVPEINYSDYRFSKFKTTRIRFNKNGTYKFWWDDVIITEGIYVGKGDYLILTDKMTGAKFYLYRNNEDSLKVVYLILQNYGDTFEVN